MKSSYSGNTIRATPFDTYQPMVIIEPEVDIAKETQAALEPLRGAKIKARKRSKSLKWQPHDGIDAAPGSWSSFERAIMPVDGHAESKRRGSASAMGLQAL
jgi:hypothetical protein